MAALQQSKSKRLTEKELLDKIGNTGAAVFALVIAVVLWLACGYFTILFVADLFKATLDAKNVLWWSIPAGFSFVEIKWWPKAWNYRTAVFGTVAVPDVASTIFGMALFFAGRSLPLFTGIQLPESGPGLMIPVIALSIAITFLPERLATRAIADIRMIWGI